jgi:hypothetical protein
MKHQENLPISALPYFLRISASFCNALQESLDFYNDHQDSEAFSKILHHLSNDFEYYVATYQKWCQDATASAHQRDLKILEYYLQDAKKLLATAIELVRH